MGGYQVLNTHIKIGYGRTRVSKDPIQTYQLKGGVMYDVNSDMNVFFNTISRKSTLSWIM